MNPNSRIKYIDIAKGIGILLVVYGHSSLAFHPINALIHNFHMPLFFFITGLCSDEAKNTVKELFVKRWKQLIIPCFYFTIIISTIEICLGYRHISSLSNNVPYALWFLNILFISQLIIISLWKLCKNKNIRYIFVIISLICWYFASLHDQLPYSLHAIPAGCFFIALGNMWKRKYTFSQNNTQLIIQTLLLFCILCILTYIFKCQINLYSNILIHPTISYIAAIIGIYFILFLSFWIHQTKKYKIESILIELGQNSLTIMLLHQFIMYLCRSTLKVYITEKNNLIPDLIYRITETTITILLLVFLIPIINKKIKFLIGK